MALLLNKVLLLMSAIVILCGTKRMLVLHGADE